MILRAFFAAILAATLANPITAQPAIVEGVASVADGDTLEIGAVRIRLHGIDAPEDGQRCQRANGRNWRCGTVAADRLAEIAAQGPIRCEVLDRDQYGRMISRCTQRGQDIAGVLAGEGLAWAFMQFSQDYVEQEASARARRAGIWQGNAQPAWEYRADRWNRAAAESPRAGCPIKGNIARDGERIYHTPWSPYYSRTRINVANGERWFCDEAEAVAAGWRAPRR